MALYPLLFETIYKERVWGGRNLTQFDHRHLPEGQPIGEAWDVIDISRVRNGPLAGWPLSELVSLSAKSLLGERVYDRYGKEFPLLIKLIDAQDILSVQVHPDDRYAFDRGEAWGKSECWYVLQAQPGASLIHGFAQPIDRQTVERAVQCGELTRYLHTMPVQSGDAVFLPAGTVHALGQGLLIYELQQRSDTTYRLYDWGRLGLNGQPRQLHVDQALDVLDFTVWPEHRASPLPVPFEDGRHYLLACRHFALELWVISDTMRWQSDGESFTLLTVIDGPATLSYGEDGDDELPLGRGETVLLPADLGWCMLRTSDRCQVLRAYVPDLWLDIVSPLLHAGVAPAAIQRLGGYGRQNDLAPLLPTA